MKMVHFDKTFDKDWKNLMKVIQCDKIHHRDEILLTLRKTYGSDDRLSDENQSRWWKPLWWKFITVIEICTLIFDKNLLLRWKYITMMKIYETDKIHHNDENLSHWWKFITLMKIYHRDENYHQVHQIEDMRSPRKPNQHCLT